MVRLSKAGWNNVIIYAVMAFILLINFTQKKQESGNEPAQQMQLLAPEQVILTLTVNQMVSIERIGQTWRALPSVLGPQALEQMMMSWHNASVEPVEAPTQFDQSQAVIVSALLAGDSDLHYFMLSRHEGQLLVFKQSPEGNEQWFVSPIQIYDQLLPAALLETTPL